MRPQQVGRSLGGCFCTRKTTQKVSTVDWDWGFAAFSLELETALATACWFLYGSSVLAWKVSVALSFVPYYNDRPLFGVNWQHPAYLKLAIVNRMPLTMRLCDSTARASTLGRAHAYCGVQAAGGRLQERLASGQVGLPWCLSVVITLLSAV